MLQSIKNQYHLLRAAAATTVNGFPSSKMTVIGVTGTDGKTTTSNYMFHILKAAGKKVAVISTISAIIDDKEYHTGFHVTTPGSEQIQSYLKKAKEKGVEYVVLEVTSHALDQNRVFGIPFKVGILTNISHEHLDYHKTMDRYVKAKLRLLKKAKIAIVNKDDDSYKEVTRGKWNIDNRKIMTYGLKKDSDVNPSTFRFSTKLLGQFNQYNALAAIAAARALRIPDDQIRKGISSTPIPQGRQEVVYDQDFTVMVDFAHTPNALKNILQAVKEKMNGRGRIIHVFGSAGERDKGKRPAMGKTSSKFSDVIILTAEDPRKERVESISSAIRSGIDRKREVHLIPDRAEAIKKAISLAKKNDTVIITGKGHEQSMNLGKGEIAWSDIEAVKTALGTQV